MNGNKVHSRRTLPTFSWEEKPGVRKLSTEGNNKSTEKYSYFSGTDDYQGHRHSRGGRGDDDYNKSQSFKVMNKLPPPPGKPENKYRPNSFQIQNDLLQIPPPPPCSFRQPPPLRCSSRKKNNDPFLIAYKECTKSSRKDHNLCNPNNRVTTGGGGDGGGDGDGGLMGLGLGFGLGLKKKKKKNISFLFCKESCSSVVSDSITKTRSQFPVLRSRKETCKDDQNS